MERKNVGVIDNKVIACFGDSITAGLYDEDGLGWPHRMAAKIARLNKGHHLIHNLAVCNDTSCDVLHSLIANAARLYPQIVIIMAGTNDCQRKEYADGSGRERFSRLEAMSYWYRMFEAIKGRGYKVLVVSPLPLEYDSLAQPRFFDNPKECAANVYRNCDIKPYVDDLESLCADRNVPFLRLYEDWLEKKADNIYADGVHPNAKGYELLADKILEKLQQLAYI